MLNFSVADDVAHIAIDDGKANAVGHAFLDALETGLDRAEKEAKAAVISGRIGVFSGGFDLKEFQKGPAATAELAARGGRMLLRLFSHPQPTIAACGGHAVAAGALILLASDTRLAAAGDFKIGLNETAIGMSLPVFATQLAAARLSKRHQTRAFVQAALLDPQEAQDAGFVDEVVAAEDLVARAMTSAAQLAELPTEAYAANKRAIRAPFIDAIAASL